MSIAQKWLFSELEPVWHGMPTTRYQGSKRKLLPLLHSVLEELDFASCLDAFGGTGSVSHLLRKMGKRVQYNDILPSNCVIAKALFANKPISITMDLVEDLFTRKQSVAYKDIISKNYRNIYFQDEENEQLDTFCGNITLIENETIRSEAYYLLFQSMLCKRPYNLFHRANLHMRTKDVHRSFGNKVTWEKPFLVHMHKFHKELSAYREYISEQKVKITCSSAFDLKEKFDLVYIDTPYAKTKGAQESNYFNFYHFLDAIVNYSEIPALLKPDLKHKPIYEYNKPWHPGTNLLNGFEKLFERCAPATLVISYRNDGHPTPNELLSILGKRYNSVKEKHLADYKYVLSKRKVDTKEIVIIAKDATKSQTLRCI